MSYISVDEEEKSKVLHVLDYYEIKTDCLIRKNTIGYVNTTFLLEQDGEKYILRESHRNTEKEHIELEIEILEHLQGKKFPYSAKILRNKNQAYITEIDGVFYVLQNFLPGEVKASWNNLNNFTPVMRAELFRVLAQFTRAMQDFTPSKKPHNKNILYYVENFESLLNKQIQKCPESPGKDWLKKYTTELLQFAQSTKQELEEVEYEKIPTQCLHFDMHPGNVHFDEHDTIVGIFDFDWASFDTGFADIASTIAQSCYIFGGENTGMLVPEYVHDGLKSYRDSYGTSEIDIHEENRLIRLSLQGYYLLQCIWSNNHYIEGDHSEERFEIVRTFTNTCLKNDLKKIFS